MREIGLHVIHTQPWWGWVMALIPLLLFACDRQAPSASPTDAIPPKAVSGVIVAFGDSLTEGYGFEPERAYPALLERRLNANGYNYKVINAGISGETSSGALSRVDWILKLNPDIVVLETGANDGLMGISPALVEQNLSRIVAKLQQNGVTVILAGMKMLANLGRTYTREFESSYPKVATSYGVALIPFFLEGVATRRALNLADGIHPNAKGYEVIADLVLPYVIDAIQD